MGPRDILIHGCRRAAHVQRDHRRRLFRDTFDVTGIDLLTVLIRSRAAQIFSAYPRGRVHIAV